MILLRKFNEEEILEAVAKFASDSLPKDKQGYIDAKYDKKNHTIEVYFIENLDNSKILS